MVPKNRPNLAICYESGKMQIMKNENDDMAIIVDTGIQAAALMWNHDGTILATCGMKNSLNEKESNQVMFYSAYGIVSLHFNYTHYYC